MLVRKRKSRFYFLRRFFEYPIRFTADTLSKLGAIRVFRIGLSYMRAVLFPPRRIDSLEQFFISRFGEELYRTFFKSYTEKVWGVPCREISAEWGAQRIKGLSIVSSLTHFVRQLFRSKSDIAQKDIETSLIEQFLYPKFGPGQMWEEVAGDVERMGGQVLTEWEVQAVNAAGGRVESVIATNAAGETREFAGDYFFSTMAVKDLMRALRPAPPAAVLAVSEGLMYRDFITVGLLANRLSVTENDGTPLKDNWIYIQEPDVKVGRLQIFNNWSPWLVESTGKVWIGLEYFCNETDPLWKLSDEKMTQLAIEEVARIGILKAEDVEDSHVVRVPKTYPAYFGSYSRFDVIRRYTDRFENLFLVGRNGMHKYNNQDHSMLTAMAAVENIVDGITAKDNIWAINTEMEYHEERSAG
jgi:protoporphyrinogen oxidase